MKQKHISIINVIIIIYSIKQPPLYVMKRNCLEIEKYHFHL